MSYLICPDVSEHNPALTVEYKGDFLILRVTFGAYWLDKHFLENANAVAQLALKGTTLKGVLLYTVYTMDPVAAQYQAVWSAIGPKIPDWLAGIMIDVETWRKTSYSLDGDHSSRINQLIGMHAHKLGRKDGIVVYGNKPDLDILYPKAKRDPKVKFILAAYTSSWVYRLFKNAIGQQYTDGTFKYPTPTGTRRSTAPFGAVDHNAFLGIKDGAALMTLLRPGSVVKPPPVPPVVVPPAVHPYYDPAKSPHFLTDPEGQFAVILTKDGQLIVHQNGKYAGKVQVVK